MTDNSNAEPELLSCPFCGGKANAGWFAITHNIGCDECGYSLDACKSDIGLSYEDSFTPEVEAAIAKFNVTRWNTRADLARAQIAAAYEAAASKVAIHMLGRNKEFADRVVAHVRALTPADAKAKLDAMLKAERAKAYERAAVAMPKAEHDKIAGLVMVLRAYEPETEYERGFVDACAAVLREIRALTQEDV